MSKMKLVNLNTLADEIANHFYNENTEDMTFAINYPFDTNNPEIFTEDNCTGWYFAKLINIMEYDSNFILIDYCGGGSATVAPIIWHEDDVEFIQYNVFQALRRIFADNEELALVVD